MQFQSVMQRCVNAGDGDAVIARRLVRTGESRRRHPRVSFPDCTAPPDWAAPTHTCEQREGGVNKGRRGHEAQADGNGGTRSAHTHVNNEKAA